MDVLAIDDPLEIWRRSLHTGSAGRAVSDNGAASAAGRAATQEPGTRCEPCSRWAPGPFPGGDGELYGATCRRCRRAIPFGDELCCPCAGTTDRCYRCGKPIVADSARNAAKTPGADP